MPRTAKTVNQPPPYDGPPLVVAMLNRKGGVGKSSSCQHLGGAFAKAGRRVLLVDMDPQASLTQGFFGPQKTESLPPRETVVALFDDACEPDPEKLIRPTPFAGISILPGSNDLDSFNVPDPQQQAGDYQTALRGFLKEVRPNFDVILIDCPPNLHLCSWNALLAADFVMVPLQAEDFGAQGITHVQRAIDAALAKYNPVLRLLGYLVTMHQKRLGVHMAYEHQLRSLYGTNVFTETMPLAKDFKEAVAGRTPLSHFKPRCAGAKTMHAITLEIDARAERLRGESPQFLYFGNRVGVGPEATGYTANQPIESSTPDDTTVMRRAG